ncbi:type I polyketide synthase [Micromonospora gifhornensis]|uniref:type I polyketide synthase n=1 Tax=Micromonospora gifhornensis TaxID=84594 RepID=UPI0034554997
MSLEPIAIVGMACRFAGGIDSPDAFWEMLCDGRDAVGDLPAGRWDWYAQQGREHATAVRSATSRGAFLDDIAGFDADFFGVTPREAALMDPQQRMVLELAWEALEHAGIPPGQLAGTDTGVYVGVGADDYGRRMLEDLPRIEAWTGVGGGYCGVANRVSYLLDLRGPSMVLDTACSSSLVAVHLAAQALRNGECPVALAGGVLVIAAPGLSLVLDAAGATAPDGRSKAFDAAADGYGRGEGGGVVVLKRLADARRDGDRVLAVLRGSAVHQDGRTDGIMAPSAQAQAHLLRRAYQNAGVDPSTVGYVEAHGTGTRAGDPLEAQAMSAVLGAGRPADRPLLIGSAKTNIGHLEAGAGVAGLIKAVLTLRHGVIPPSLHVRTPNPAIPWDTAGLKVVTELTPWVQTEGPRRAGVCGYGYGGTIAHVILEAADEQPAADEQSATDVPDPATPQPALYPLSGASAAAVGQYAARLADRLDRPHPPALADVGYTLARRRDELPYRATVVAADRTELVERLRALAAPSGVGEIGRASAPAGRGVVWVFSGHGSQWIGMGRELLHAEPVFAEVLDELEPIFQAELDVSPGAALRAQTAHPVDVIQPLIFAVQVALAAVLRAHGAHPAAVLGHSVGEIAAAVTAGLLTREQGARLVCRRSVLLRRVAGQGAMAMVDLPPEEAEQRLTDDGDVCVAIAASPVATVISGSAAAVRAVSRRWADEGLDVRMVDSDVAFHSPQMDELTADLAAACADLPPAEVPTVAVYSTASTDSRTAAPRDGAYWAANLREQVRLAQAVEAAAADGYRLFLEVSAHPVVTHSIAETLDLLGVEDTLVAHTLRRHRPERESLLGAVGRLWRHGAPLDWAGPWPTGSTTALPPIAWQHRPFWYDEPSVRSFLTEQHDPEGHTVLGGRITVRGATPAHAWMTYLDRDSRPYPGDHPVRGVEILPAAVLLHTFLTAAETLVGARPELTDVALRVPVSVTAARYLQVVHQDGIVRLSSRIADGDESAWTTHTTAVVVAAPAAVDPEPVLSVPTGGRLPTTYVVDRLAELGVAAMGFHWRVEQLRRDGRTLTALVDAGDPAGGWAPVLDAALSIASVAFDGPPILRMPAHIGRVSLGPVAPQRVRVVVHRADDDTLTVEIAELGGVVLGRLHRLRYGTLDQDSDAVTDPRNLLHEVAWTPAETHQGGHRPPARVLLVGPPSALRDRVAAALPVAGVHRSVVSGPAELPSTVAGTVIVVPGPGVGGEPAAQAAWLLAQTAQRLAEARSDGTRLWCVTEGVRESVDPSALGHAALWGLGRIVAGEHPTLWGALVDVGTDPADLGTFVGLLGGRPADPLVAVRDGQVTVPRLRPLTEPSTRPPLVCRPEATYLITGGLGALGLTVARWLADRGARRLVLAGRHTPPPRDTWHTLTDARDRAVVDAIDALERLGVTVVTAQVDVADPAALAELSSSAPLGLPPIRGVVHAAGVLDNRTLLELDEPSLRAVLRPKVDGALALHHRFPPGELDLFVLFSSCGGLLGLPGQASYAAGNAFLDALAAHRRAAGDVGTLSLAWTSWRGLGMSTSSEVIDLELAARGTGDISAAEALGAWELAARQDREHAVVLRTLPPAPGTQRPALLSELTAPAAAAPPTESEAWRELAGGTLREFLADTVRGEVVATTGLSAAEIDDRQPLTELGLDSVMTVRIRRNLERRLAMSLPATIFWERPSVDAVTELLADLVGAVAEEAQ